MGYMLLLAAARLSARGCLLTHFWEVYDRLGGVFVPPSRGQEACTRLFPLSMLSVPGMLNPSQWEDIAKKPFGDSHCSDVVEDVVLLHVLRLLRGDGSSLIHLQARTSVRRTLALVTTCHHCALPLITRRGEFSDLFVHGTSSVLSLCRNHWTLLSCVPSSLAITRVPTPSAHGPWY